MTSSSATPTQAPAPASTVEPLPLAKEDVLMAEQRPAPGEMNARQVGLLQFSVLVVGLCTILYELLIGTVSSYLLGDSIRQFSMAIGLTMFAMGIGTWCSRWVNRPEQLLFWFVLVEVVLGLVGGLSVPVLYGVYLVGNGYLPIMVLLVLGVGALIGLEIPLLTRLLEHRYSLKLNISNVLSLDYLGALLATFLFPFLLLPVFGVFQSSVVVGLLNLLTGGLSLVAFWPQLSRKQQRGLSSGLVLATALLLTTLLFSKQLLHGWESQVYEDQILLSTQTPYQQLVLTRNRQDLRLYLNGNLQFSTLDEYRYHEALVHVPMGLAPTPENVLILGGGDGLAVREVLKHPKVKTITLVDLDAKMLSLFQKHPVLRQINHNSLNHPKVRLVSQDAFKFLEQTQQRYDVVLVDLPDPNSNALTRLYTVEFYRLLQQRLSRTGLMVTQATSPYFAPEAFWCIAQTLTEANFSTVKPYHAYIPAFGDWGFVLASQRHLPSQFRLPPNLRYLTQEGLPSLFLFSPDVRRSGLPANRLNRPILLEFYLAGWKANS
ncbi:MAG: polyamine aminopropyltransferase [Candidatus Melainabacteria bacterium]|nr:polyamine aminopropyltransferase [Candidatus Melainabacteria bacterium]